jgi:hypothetical protein
MNTLGTCLTAMSFAALLGLCSCSGSMKPASSSPAPTTTPSSIGSTLAGNWVITSKAPTTVTTVSTFGSPDNEQVRLALTIDATEDKIVAGGFGNHFCAKSAGSFNLANALSGMIAQDGTFTLQSPAGLLDTSTITGKIPPGQGLPWSGTYTLAFGESPAGLALGCVETVSDSFTATYFPMVSGVYTGTATSMGASTAITMQMQLNLQQGGVATDVVSGKTISGNTVLTGSIKVQGSPCFTTGTASGGLSNVLGNRVQTQFVMDDGSMLGIVGTLSDPTEMKITTDSVRIAGPCVNAGFPVLYLSSELDKQS